jgi:hypothetical protein
VFWVVSLLLGVRLFWWVCYVGALCSSGFFFLGAFRRSLLYPGVIELCFKLALFDKYNITYQKKKNLSSMRKNRGRESRK